MSTAGMTADEKIQLLTDALTYYLKASERRCTGMDIEELMRTVLQRDAENTSIPKEKKADILIGILTDFLKEGAGGAGSDPALNRETGQNGMIIPE